MNRRRFVSSLIAAAAAALSAARAEAAPAPAEQSLIDRLITYVERQRGMTFVRNGKEHSCADAAKFLRGKMEAMGDEVVTAHDFIDRIATRSSTSGDPYHVKFADGRMVPASTFLRDELKRIESSR